MKTLTRLNSTQLEILKLFSRDLPEEHWKEMKDLFLKYLAEKVMDHADKIWDEKGWTNEDMDRLLLNEERTPYNNNN